MMHAISNQMHAMPGHKAHAQQTLNQGAHSRGEFPPGLRMYQELSALGPNATRHDESSDDEAAPASLSAPWAGQDQRGNGQMVRLALCAVLALCASCGVCCTRWSIVCAVPDGPSCVLSCLPQVYVLPVASVSASCGRNCCL
jgi:hypothetical protein